MQLEISVKKTRLAARSIRGWSIMLKWYCLSNPLQWHRRTQIAFDIAEALCLAVLAKACLEDDPLHRPTMDDIMKVLARMVWLSITKSLRTRFYLLTGLVKHSLVIKFMHCNIMDIYRACFILSITGPQVCKL